ncbi:MAG TPA: M48 family metallopeptidase [Acidobacteriaceae bacterium]|nr:M48 family metallopeptidase [Acidobacteriaceae bacterium]
MSRIFYRFCIPFLLLLLHLFAQAEPPAACGAPPTVLLSSQPNIFNEQQEQWLGDAMADMVERDNTPVQDAAENEYLDHIAKRLLDVLPPTKIRFRVILVDSPEVNGFSLAGGRVYLTRKLVANARSEDEVASVIAHEMGHILSHQFAIETTADLKRLLNVTSVTDKADIYAKFQHLIDASLKDKHPGQGGDSDDKQNEADLVAVYATAAAGYRPQAYAEFWDRMFFVKGKVGGPLSDFFGVTKPESKRLRAIQKLVAALPPGCGASDSNDNPAFEEWRSLVIANQPGTLTTDIKPISQSVLTPPLRMDLEQLRFSRDGRYILAQDETSIFVLNREPYYPIFRFDAENALPAEFSPDSKHVVFLTRGLHTEEWSIADQKLVTSHEPLSQHDCIQSKLSPDGRTIFCIALREDDPYVYLDLFVLNVADGSVIFQKKGFFEPTFNFLVQLAISAYSPVPTELMYSSLSSDGNFLLIGPSESKLAFDLRNRTLVPVKGDLKHDVTGAYAFIGSDKVLGVASGVPDRSGLFSFPEGRRLQAAPFELADLESVTDGNYVLSHDVKDYAIGLADVSQSQFIAASKAPAMDVWNGVVVNETVDGAVLMRKIVKTENSVTQSATLALSPLGGAVRTALSDDGRLLAISTRTRGGIWDANTGQRLVLTHSFNSAFFAPDDSLYAEFAKFGNTDRAIAKLSFGSGPAQAKAMNYKEEDDTRLTFGMLQQWKHIDRKHTELIVHKVDDNSVLWSRTFEGGEPAHTYNLVPGETILSFPLKTDFARNRMNEISQLGAEAAGLKEKDSGRLIQVLDNSTGKILHELVLLVPQTYTGVGGVNVVGNQLYLSSGDNRTMVYDLGTRTQLRQLFGYVIAVDPTSNRVCTVNRRDEAVVYDAEGHQVASYHTGAPLRFAHFEQSGGRLMLFTADQKIRVVQIEAGATN